MPLWSSGAASVTNDFAQLVCVHAKVKLRRRMRLCLLPTPVIRSDAISKSRLWQKHRARSADKGGPWVALMACCCAGLHCTLQNCYDQHCEGHARPQLRLGTNNIVHSTNTVRNDAGCTTWLPAGRAALSKMPAAQLILHHLPRYVCGPLRQRPSCLALSKARLCAGLAPNTELFCRQEAFDGTGAAFVYPRGATLTVQRPAIAILGSGKVAFPMHKALGEQACPASKRLLISRVAMLPWWHGQHGQLVRQPSPHTGCCFRGCIALKGGCRHSQGQASLPLWAATLQQQSL